jgi:serine/threonine-protein kinase
MSRDAADRAHWQRVKALLAQALELEGAAQRAFVDAACAGDAALREELVSLLAAARGAGADLDRPPAGRAPAAVEAGAHPAWAGRRVGPWRVLSLVASGAAGDVWRAEPADGHAGPHVAIKAMRICRDAEGVIARLRGELRILTRVAHPNLARVLDGGVTDDGVPYFVMEFVDGEPIDAWCERLRLPLAARLRLFGEVCRAVHDAHGQHVVHRDLKVGNILVTPAGVVKLVDFGIPRRFDPATPGPHPATRHLGAHPYASPEQMRGEELTAASDIYSLGAVLYRLLTNASPYPGAADGDERALVRAIREATPPPPSRAAAAAPVEPRRLRGDLDAIVMTALRKAPSRRYASASALADDVARHLAGLPVRARRGAWLARAGELVRRRRAVAGA